jgi:SAM-dependent methyltransferase
VPPGRATEWEPESERWIEWTRSPGFDAYWTYSAAFFADVLAPAGPRTLEVGCGEGRVARDLSARGHNVVAIEPARSLLAAANAAGSSGEQYAIADGLALPFVDAAFDVVVAYNVLQVVDDLDLALSEVARVLVPGGHLCACIAHPVTDLGEVSEDPGGPRLTIREHYFEPCRVDETVEVAGHAMTFRGRTHSLEHYSLALERAGLLLERMREPRPDIAASAFSRWRAVPLFLNFRAVSPPSA